MKIDKKILKKALLTISMIMLVITIFEINSLYALFYSEAHGTIQEDLGKWYITVNNTDISSGSVQSFTLDQLNVISNSHTKAGKIAPDMQGDFQIVINPNDTDVSIRYDLTIDNSALDGHSITIDSIEEIEENNTLVMTGNNTYTGIIPLSDIQNNVKNTIKITFNWENNEQYNPNDTILGTTENSKLRVPVNLTVSQYLGEQIS